jgi:hypothetical protein
VPGAPSTPGIRRGGSTVAWGSDPSVSIRRPNRCGQIGARWKSVPGTCPGRGGRWKSVPGTCPGRGGMLAICGPGWKSVPGTCPRRGDASNLRGGLEIGARHLPKDAAEC